MTTVSMENTPAVKFTSNKSAGWRAAHLYDALAAPQPPTGFVPPPGNASTARRDTNEVR